jgi:hypothetical protein
MLLWNGEGRKNLQGGNKRTVDGNGNGLSQDEAVGADESRDLSESIEAAVFGRVLEGSVRSNVNLDELKVELVGLGCHPSWDGAGVGLRVGMLMSRIWWRFGFKTESSSRALYLREHRTAFRKTSWKNARLLWLGREEEDDGGGEERGGGRREKKIATSGPPSVCRLCANQAQARAGSSFSG